MSENINKLIEFIKINKDNTSDPSYLLSLNDENITLSEVFYRSNILAETDIDSDMSMVDVISEVCRGLKKALNTQDIFVAIELHSFAGYDASVNDGPIKLIFMGEDGKHVGLRFTTNSIKNSNWLIEFMRYTEGMSDLFGQEKNIDEYNKLSDFLYKLEFGNDEIDMCQEDNSPQK